MSSPYNHSRRKFIRQIGGTAAMVAGGSLLAQASGMQKRELLELPARKGPANPLRFATIGMGIEGFVDTRTALEVPNVQLVAVSDLYQGRLTRSQELFGKDIFTTRDYREILKRKDIDAVVIATHDLWHDTISMEAMRAGKGVYCEKPMVQHLDLGKPVIQVQKETGRVLEVGSQRVSSIAYSKARDIYRSGRIGKLNLVEAKINRHDALGAWQYSIPPDAGPRTIDFETFLKNTPKVPFDAIRFFRWRNYKAYGTGIPGDLFVHLISGLHFITGALGPERILASGELSYWKDGRDVPDVMTALLDYPETEAHPKFQVQLQVDFADGSGGGEYTRFIGTEGMMEMDGNSFQVKTQLLPKAPGYGGWDSFNTFPEAIQQEFVKEYDKRYPPDTRLAQTEPDISYAAPDGYDERLDHMHNFFQAVQGGPPVVEDASFGFRACAPAIACNLSYFEKQIIHWDPVQMKRI